MEWAPSGNVPRVVQWSRCPQGIFHGLSNGVGAPGEYSTGCPTEWNEELRSRHSYVPQAGKRASYDSFSKKTNRAKAEAQSLTFFRHEVRRENIPTRPASKRETHQESLMSTYKGVKLSSLGHSQGLSSSSVSSFCAHLGVEGGVVGEVGEGATEGGQGGGGVEDPAEGVGVRVDVVVGVAPGVGGYVAHHPPLRRVDGGVVAGPVGPGQEVVHQDFGPVHLHHDVLHREFVQRLREINLEGGVGGDLTVIV
eukprot:9239404-Pyramimonas_sp.AAC.1